MQLPDAARQAAPSVAMRSRSGNSSRRDRGIFSPIGCCDDEDQKSAEQDQGHEAVGGKVECEQAGAPAKRTGRPGGIGNAGQRRQ